MNEGFIEINPEELPAVPPVEESFRDVGNLPEKERAELKQLIHEIREQEN